MPNKCPKDRTFTRLFLGNLSEDRRSAVIDHTFACPVCRPKFKILVALWKELNPRKADIGERSLSKTERREVREIARSRLSRLKAKTRPSLRKGWITAAAAATLLLAVIGGYQLLVVGPGKSRISRETRSGALVLLEPIKLVREIPREFRWKAVRDGDSYKFELFNENLEVLVCLDTPGTRLIILDETARSLTRGSSYVWIVTAFNDDGEVIGSERAGFKIEGP